MKIPSGYEGRVMSYPKSLEVGIEALPEPYFNVPDICPREHARVHAASVSIRLNHVSCLSYRPNDYIVVPKGYVIAVLQIVKG